MNDPQDEIDRRLLKVKPMLVEREEESHCKRTVLLNENRDGRTITEETFPRMRVRDDRTTRQDDERQRKEKK